MLDADPVYVPRAEANESSSSNTMIDGALWRARTKICRMRSSLSPTHRLFSSGPLTIVTAAPSEVAIALANSVLPVPGGPQKIMPRGTSPSTCLIRPSSSSVSLWASRSRISVFSRSLTFS